MRSWNRDDLSFERYATTYNEGIVYRFDVDDVDTPLFHLRKELLRKTISLTDLSPREMELVVGSVLRDLFDVRVEHIGGPGDSGIDLLLVSGDRKQIVQVKRRKDAAKSESVAVVRDVIGSMILNDVSMGVVVTSCTRFSRAANAVAASVHLERHGLTLSLYNRDKVMEMLELADPPERPWLAICDKEGYDPPDISSEITLSEPPSGEWIPE